MTDEESREDKYDGEDDDDEISELSSSPSIPDENIDFNFVYALHTFVATVEGQATCQKGDYLTLLDDTNSYWWLIRNLKDQSIGYLPAEHIETPPERLARFNKHRNVDYGAPGLEDMATPPMKASKRGLFKSKKTASPIVAFNEPKFIEFDTYYDTEEEQELGLIDDATAIESEIAANQTTEPSYVVAPPLMSAAEDATTVHEAAKQTAQPKPGELLTHSEMMSNQSPTKKLSLTPASARDSVLVGSRQEAVVDVSEEQTVSSPARSTHATGASQSSIHSETSAVSTDVRDQSRPEKAKRKNSGVFGGLFKRKSTKRDKNEDTEPVTGVTNQEKARDAVEGMNTKRSTLDSAALRANLESIPLDTSLDHATKASAQIAARDEQIELPESVKEMQSSIIMNIDPVTTDAVHSPENRGMVDELDVLHHHQEEERRMSMDSHLLNDGKATPRGKQLHSHAHSTAASVSRIDTEMTDAQLRAHMADTTFHKRLRLLVHLEGRETLRHTATSSQIIAPDSRYAQSIRDVNECFAEHDDKLNKLTQELDALLFSIQQHPMS